MGSRINRTRPFLPNRICSVGLRGPLDFLPRLVFSGWLVAVTALLVNGMVGSVITACSPQQVLDQLAEESEVQQSKFPEDLKTRAPNSIEELKLLEQRTREVLDKVAAATVSLGNGSGVVVGDQGYILTAAHVNGRAGRRVRVTFPDGTSVRGETLGNNFGGDFGMVKITAAGDWPSVEMGDSSDCVVGQWCVATGFPLTFQRGSEPPVRLGRVLRTNSRVIMTDCPIMGGDSGGPLFDMDGRVIGIHSRVNNSIRQNYHVPVNAYRDSWDRLVDAEDWNQRRRGRGSRQRRQSDPEQESRPGYLGVRRVEGVDQARVGEVIAGGAAEKAGVQPGDLIVKLGDQNVGSFQQLVQLVSQRKAGEKTTLTIRRDGRQIRLDLTMGARQ